jgi:solute:Na+ symporter, SSS family
MDASPALGAAACGRAADSLIPREALGNVNPISSTALSTLDYGVIASYLLVTLAIGVYLGRKIRSGSEFFLAGRQLPWWAVGMSLVATDIGGTDIIGVGGATYKHGLAVANFEWIGCIPAMILGAFFFVPFLYRTGVYTVPEYLERRYNLGVRTVMASCWLVFMACNLGIMLLASAKMMHSLLGWDEWTCILGMAALVGFYTSVGGLAAVVYTDVLQCVILIVGCSLLIVFGLWELGGIAGLQQRLAENSQSAGSNLQLMLPVDTPSPYPWPGILFGLAMILSPAYWIGNQAIVQRSLGARSELEAKASYVWGALLKNIIPVVIAVPGLIAIALLPDLKDGDLAIPQLVTKILPSGFRGIFFAAFLAAMMSSVDSYLNAASTIVSYDFLKRFSRKEISETALLRVGRLTTIACVLWAVFFAFVLTRMKEGSGIYAVFQTLMAFFQGPALAVLLTGMLWRRATGKAALIALILGITTSILLYTLNQPAIYMGLGWRPLFQIQEPFLYFSIWAFLVTWVALVVLSWLTRAEPEARSGLVIWNRGRVNSVAPQEPAS